VPEDFDIKALVTQVLDVQGFTERRGKQLDIDDYLQYGLRFAIVVL
jgi:hypothetical protein